MRHVLDASAAIRIVLGDADRAPLVAALQTSEFVMAPSLFHSEVSNTLWKYVRAGLLDAAGAQARYRDAVDLVDHFEADADLAVAALAAASTHHHPVYDLIYLVLARRHGCDLITADRKLLALWNAGAGALT